jgi:hypothetical protein
MRYNEIFNLFSVKGGTVKGKVMNAEVIKK